MRRNADQAHEDLYDDLVQQIGYNGQNIAELSDGLTYGRIDFDAFLRRVQEVCDDILTLRDNPEELGEPNW